MEDYLVAKSEAGKYILKIFVDEHPVSPREHDNLGKMVCWHRGFSLGDEHDYSSPTDFAFRMAEDVLGLSEEVLEGRDLDSVTAELLTSSKIVMLPLYLLDHSGLWMRTTGFSDVDPGRWDWGQVGWIYCTKKRFLEETGYTEDELFSIDRLREPKVGEHVRLKGRSSGDCGWGRVTAFDGQQASPRVVVDFDYCKTPDTRKPENRVTVPLSEVSETLWGQARRMLENEVQEFNAYLTGDVYGFNLIERERCEHCGHERQNVVDSCWGFVGEDNVRDDVKAHLSPEFHHLLERLVSV